jgi:hypothetical protein
MQPTSVHEIVVAQVRALVEGAAVIADVATLGTEQVVLLLELVRGDEAGPPGEPPPIPADPTAGEALELHFFLPASTPVFWAEAVTRRRFASGVGFSDWLRLHAQGARVLKVSAGDSGRILRLDLAGARDGAHCSLALDPLPNACRFLVLDAKGRVEQRFPAPIHASSAGRGTPGSIYEEPRGTFVERWQRVVIGASEAAASGVAPNIVAGEAAPSGAAPDIVAGHGAPNADARSRERSVPAGPPPLWLCEHALAPGREFEIFLSPSPAEELPGARAGLRTLAGPYPPLEAARLLGERCVARARDREARRTVHQQLAAERKHVRRLVQRIGGEIDEARGGGELRRQAEALLIQAGRLPKGAAEVEIPDATDPERTLRVQLDPGRSFAENVNLLFRRAGKLERALAVRAARRDQLARVTTLIDAWLERTDQPPVSDASRSPAKTPTWLPSPDELRQARAVQLDPGLRARWERLLARLRGAARSADAPLDRVGYESRRAGRTGRAGRGGGGGEDTRRRERGAGGERPDRHADSGSPEEPARGPTEAAAERAGIHPRRFVLPDGWVVLVGRSNAENDVLTHQAARPRDLWFHARGVAGSHVVLQRGDRKDNPSKAALDQAASIAAYYSKARTSRHAPVIHTEKRYVRKPRKAPPGLAVCLREKVLMVEPRLPAGSADESP